MAYWNSATADEDPDDEIAPPFDARDLIGASVARSWRLIFAFAVLGGLAGLVWGLYQTNTYVSTAQLLLRVGAREDLTAEDFLGQASPASRTSTPIRDEIALLSDMAIYVKVARLLGPAEILDPGDPTMLDGAGTPWYVRKLHVLQRDLQAARWNQRLILGEGPNQGVALAAEVLRRNTRLWVEDGSNVIHVAYTSSSPERAQRVTFALVDAFLQRHRNQFSIEPYFQSNLTQVEEARERSDRAQKAKYDHLAECGFYDLEAQWAEMFSENDELERELYAARTREVELINERDQVSARLSDMGVTSEYDELLRKRRKLQADRAVATAQARFKEELQRQLRGYDEQIREVELELKKLESSLPSAVRAKPSESVSVVSEAENVRRRMDSLDTELRNLGVRIARLDGRLQDVNLRMNRLRECSAIHPQLENAVTTEKAAFERLAERFATVEALRTIEREGDINLRMMHEPTLPFEKHGPKRPLMAAGGLFAGLFGGLLLAIVRQAFDRRLRYPGSTQRALGVPVLAVVPTKRIPKAQPMGSSKAGVA